MESSKQMHLSHQCTIHIKNTTDLAMISKCLNIYHTDMQQYKYTQKGIKVCFKQCSVK